LSRLDCGCGDADWPGLSCAGGVVNGDVRADDISSGEAASAEPGKAPMVGMTE
jgi:hypothetical protein